MPLTLLTAGSHIRRNKRLLLASGLCMSAHAALLLFGLQPTQTRAVTLDSLSAGSALVLNLSNSTTGTAPASLSAGQTPAQTQTPAQPQPQDAKPKAPEHMAPEQVKPAPQTVMHSKPTTPMQKKQSEKKQPKSVTDKAKTPELKNNVATTPATNSTPIKNSTPVKNSAPLKTAAATSTAPQGLSANQSANNASSAAGSPTAHPAQTSGSSAQPRFRVPPSAPEYPKASRMRRQEGIVLLEVKLGSQGEQLQVMLVKSSGFPLLDRSALKAVKGWQFLPQEINGKGVSHVVRIPVRFELT